MRVTARVAIGGALVLATVACGRHRVDTAAYSKAGVAGFRSFTVLEMAKPRDGRKHAGCYDPMAEGSVATEALRSTVIWALKNRGYAEDNHQADFAVVIYASADQSIDLTMWSYGYSPWPDWRSARAAPHVYPPGTVVLDFVSGLPNERQLLWRGSGEAKVTSDPAQNLHGLRQVAEAIVKRFPHAVERPIASAGRAPDQRVQCP